MRLGADAIVKAFECGMNGGNVVIKTDGAADLLALLSRFSSGCQQMCVGFIVLFLIHEKIPVNSMNGYQTVMLLAEYAHFLFYALE